MMRIITEYILVHSLIRSCGFERALNQINMNILQTFENHEEKTKHFGIIQYIKWEIVIKRIKKMMEISLLSGNCVSIALFLYWKLHVAGYNPIIINEVRVVDSKVEAHLWVRIGNLKLNDIKWVDSMVIRKIEWDKEINKMVEGLCG